MPIYKYQCQACHKTHEALQKMDDLPLTTCPHCQREALKKLPSAPAFTFKGSGWYKDLYSSSRPSDAAPSSSTAAAKATPPKTADSPAPPKKESA